MNAQPLTRAPRAVWFPDWFQVLWQTDLAESTRSQYRTVVLESLRFRKQVYETQPSLLLTADAFADPGNEQRCRNPAPWKESGRF